MRVPFGLNAADLARSSGMRRIAGSPVPSAFHTRRVLSSERVTIWAPSGLNALPPPAARPTDPPCPTRIRGVPLPSAFQTRAVLSEEAVTMRVPSGLNAAERTTPWCPSGSVAFRSHRRSRPGRSFPGDARAMVAWLRSHVTGNFNALRWRCCRQSAPERAIGYEVTLHGVATIGSVGAEPLTADR
jgi:hypothetical protein